MEFTKQYKKGDELGKELDKFVMDSLMKVCTIKEGCHADLTTVLFKKDVNFKLIIE